MNSKVTLPHLMLVIITPVDKDDGGGKSFSVGQTVNLFCYITFFFSYVFIFYAAVAFSGAVPLLLKPSFITC